MALRYAPLCTVCHKHLTQHSSGVCSICRRSIRSRLCISCGEKRTTHASGLCHRCRRIKDAGKEDFDGAIERCERLLTALRMRQDNCSYQAIANHLGVSKSTAYGMCQEAARHPLVRDFE